MYGELANEQNVTLAMKLSKTQYLSVSISLKMLDSIGLVYEQETNGGKLSLKYNGIFTYIFL